MRGTTRGAIPFRQVFSTEASSRDRAVGMTEDASMFLKTFWSSPMQGLCSRVDVRSLLKPERKMQETCAHECYPSSTKGVEVKGSRVDVPVPRSRGYRKQPRAGRLQLETQP